MPLAIKVLGLIGGSVIIGTVILKLKPKKKTDFTDYILSAFADMCESKHSSEDTFMI